MPWRRRREHRRRPAPPHRRARRAHRRHPAHDSLRGDRAARHGRAPQGLGLSLDELKRLVEAEDAREAIRKRFRETDSDAERLRLLDEALPYVETQLALVRRRREELKRLEEELAAKRKQILARRREPLG
jgi:hypothetical protein